MRITLIRHGETKYELKGKTRSRDFSKIIEKYNISGIVGDPPYKTKEKAQQYNAAVCSDLLRSIESAEKLGIKKVYLKDSLFREVALPHFNNGSFSMSVNTWIVLFRFLSLFGFSKNGESLASARKRAKIAASILIEIAHLHGSVLLVGHGFSNYFIAKELLANNWQGPRNPGREYWGFGEYIYTAT